jgi:transforming growth factor-beta-induced protein
LIIFLLLSAATCTASALGDRTKTIVDVAEENGNFTTLLTALNATNLTDTLKGEGPFTVFAPTDRAFAALPEGKIEALLNDTGTLKKILLYHVAGQRLMAKDVVNMSNITTLEGQKLKVNVTDKGVFVGKVKIIMTDINASNGVIHEIDAVLIPPEKDIVETAKDEGNFTKLLTALNATNLTDTLKGEGPFTVFAPTDRAFAALPEGTIETLLNNTSKLKKILLFHVVSQRLMAKDVVNMSNITTLEGQKLPVNVTDKGVLVGKAKIIMTDVNASNGVIHEIDTVLIPPENNQMGGKNP